MLAGIFPWLEPCFTFLSPSKNKVKKVLVCSMHIFVGGQCTFEPSTFSPFLNSLCVIFIYRQVESIQKKVIWKCSNLSIHSYLIL